MGPDIGNFGFEILEKSRKILLSIRIAVILDFKSLKNRGKSFYRYGLLRFWIPNP
jgi:hypothetical protein